MDKASEYKPSYGVFHDIEYWWRNRIWERKAKLTSIDIVDLINKYQEVELDNHIALAGQNGTGKSWSALTIAKEYCHAKGKEFKVADVVMMGYEPANKIEERIRKGNESIFVMDEANYFLNYLDFMKKETKYVIRAIENLRAKRNILIPCIRDARRLVNTYRNGKLHTVIHLLDRIKDTNIPYGAIFMGNNFFEVEDKFLLDHIADSYSFASLFYKIEHLPTFKGIFKGSSDPLSKDEIREYLEYKEKQMNSPIGMANRSKFDEIEQSRKKIETMSTKDQNAMLRKLKQTQVVGDEVDDGKETS